MSAHTPGPWNLRAGFGFYHVSSAHTIGGELCKSGLQAICTMPYENKRGPKAYREMFAANATLIAAAPDLLEALRQMVEIAELTLGWAPTPRDANGPLIVARAAIAKATGEPK